MGLRRGAGTHKVQIQLSGSTSSPRYPTIQDSAGFLVSLRRDEKYAAHWELGEKKEQQCDGDESKNSCGRQPADSTAVGLPMLGLTGALLPPDTQSIHAVEVKGLYL